MCQPLLAVIIHLDFLGMENEHIVSSFIYVGLSSIHSLATRY